MKTKKILSFIVALAMIVTVVPVFGITAGAAEYTFAGSFAQSAGNNGNSQSVARYFGPVSGNVTITYDVVFNSSGSDLVGNDFVGFGSTSVNAVPSFGSSAIGMQGSDSESYVGFRSGSSYVGTFEPSVGETYSVTLTTNTTEKTYSGTVTKNGDTGDTIITSFTNAAYRASSTTSLNAFMNFNNGSTSDRVTVSNLVIKAGADYATVAVPSESVEVDGTYYKLSENNLITNPGFELTDGTFSVGGWLSCETNGTFGASGQTHSFKVYDGGYAYLDGTTEKSNTDYAPHGGKYALGTRWNDGETGLCSFYNDFAVEPNTTYYLSYWAKAYTAEDGLVWAGAVADTSVTATTGDGTVWIANDDDNATQKKVNATEWTQVQQIITTGADQTAIQVHAYWLGEGTSGAKPYFVFDDFVLAKAEVDTSYNKIPVTVELTADGTVVGTIDSSEGYEGYVGETVTVKAGIYAGQYYLNSDTASTEITEDGKASVEVKVLNIFTWNKSSNAVIAADGTYNAGNVVTWGDDRYAYAYATVPSYDPKTQNLVIEVEAVFNNGYYREAAPLATVKSMDAAALKAVDLTAGADATAAIDAIEKTEVASVDFYDITGDTYPVTLDQERTAAKVQIPVELAEGEIALLFEKDQSTDQGGIAVITSVEVKPVDKLFSTTVDFKNEAETVIKSVTEDIPAGGSFTVDEKEVFVLDGNFYQIPKTVVTENTTVTVYPVENKYGVLEDALVSDNEIWGIGLTNTNSVFVAAGDDANRGPSADADDVAVTDGEHTPSVLNKSRVGFVEFPVVDLEEGQVAIANFYVRTWHDNGFSNGNTSLRLAAYVINDSSWTTLSDGESYDSANANILETYPNAIFSDANYRTENLTFDVTDAMKAAKAAGLKKLDLRLNTAWGAAYIAEREAAVEGGTYEGKAAYISVETGNKVTVKGASSINRNGSNTTVTLSGDTIETYISDDGYVTAYDASGNRFLVANTNDTTTVIDKITSAGTYVVVPKITASLGFDADEDFNIIFTFDGLGDSTGTAKIESEYSGSLLGKDNETGTANTLSLSVADKNTIGVTVPNTNVIYTASVTANNLTSDLVSASIYSLVVDEIANGEYTAAGGDKAITTENLNKVNEVLAKGGLYLTAVTDEDGKVTSYTLPDENLNIMTVGEITTDETEATTVTITLTPEAQKLGLLFNNNDTINASVDGTANTNINVDTDGKYVTVTLSSAATTALAYGEVIMLDAVQLEFVPPETVEEAEADDEFEVTFDDFEDIM